MKISICYPQYNRISLLLKSLKILEDQTYEELEIIISDDCSTDNTAQEIEKIKPNYKFPILYRRNTKNCGYDRNYRRSIELASGAYCIVLGNDDTIIGADSITELVNFLKEKNFPDIGYCNYFEESTPHEIIRRATETKVQGSGVEVALKHASGFSFVGGLIYKKETFKKYNTASKDGSIYAQMYLGVRMIAEGHSLFTYSPAIVMKDLKDNISGETANSFLKDGLPKNLSTYRKMDGGLFSVANVLIEAIEDATKSKNKTVAYQILKKIYAITYPYWIQEYKYHGGYVASIGLIHGLYPCTKPLLSKISRVSKIKIFSYYLFSSNIALVVPSAIFQPIKNKLYNLLKRK